jgi:hypothetical protein
MRCLLDAVFTVPVLAAPAVSFAQQSSSTVPREQVKAELMQLERARCNPVRRNANYPEDIRAAHARVAAQSGAAPGQTSYVLANRGPSQSGVPGN